jgi:hypothetical protein
MTSGAIHQSVIEGSLAFVKLAQRLLKDLQILTAKPPLRWRLGQTMRQRLSSLGGFRFLRDIVRALVFNRIM